MTTLSARNPRVQQLRRLVSRRRDRDQAGVFVIEGPGLLREALASGHVPTDVFVVAGAGVGDASVGEAQQRGAAVHELPATVLGSVASTVSPQPVLGVLAQCDAGLHAALAPPASFVVVAAGVRDPGNAGTLIRTAAAAGADAVVFCGDAVDVFNPKVVRASAGALFRVPVVRHAPPDALWDLLARLGLRTVGLAAGAVTPYDELDLVGPVAVVAGNEATGLDPAIASRVDAVASIPMAAGVESLNVAAAVAVVCFEVSRQRRRGRP